jgi:hypothetical protein
LSVTELEIANLTARNAGAAPGSGAVCICFEGRGFTDCGKTVLFALYCSPRAAIGTDLLLVAG